MENQSEYKYDVFISYSQKDYVDGHKNILPGNIVSQIKATLDKNNLSYWIDEEGNLTGKKFAHIIAGKIRESMVFLFVCSKNSVASKWVDRELAVADEFDKHIIPFICDDSYKDDRVVMFTAVLDRIEFFGEFNPNTELEKLVNAISKDKKDLEEKRKKEAEEREKKRREEEKQKRLKEEAERREKTKEEIKHLSNDYKLHSLQQEIILQQLHDKNFFINNEKKKCPICGKEQSIKDGFCDRCGFQFPALYSIDGNNNYPFDKKHLVVAKANYAAIAKAEKEMEELTGKNEELRTILKKISEECELHLRDIEQKNEEASIYRSKCHTLSEQLQDQKKQSDEKLKQLENLKKELEDRVIELQKEIERQKKQLMQAELSEKQHQQELDAAHRDITALEEELNKTKSQHRQKMNNKIVTSQDALGIIKRCSFSDSIHTEDPPYLTINTYKLSEILDLEYGISLNPKEIGKCKTIFHLAEKIIEKNKNKELD